jgi:hypothetical protein
MASEYGCSPEDGLRLNEHGPSVVTDGAGAGGVWVLLYAFHRLISEVRKEVALAESLEMVFNPSSTFVGQFQTS